MPLVYPHHITFSTHFARESVLQLFHDSDDFERLAPLNVWKTTRIKKRVKNKRCLKGDDGGALHKDEEAQKHNYNPNGDASVPINIFARQRCRQGKSRSFVIQTYRCLFSASKSSSEGICSKELGERKHLLPGDELAKFLAGSERALRQSGVRATLTLLLYMVENAFLTSLLAFC